MTILEKIVLDKRKEVALKSGLIPANKLEKSFLFERKTFSLVDRIKRSTTGIIAEHKRRSPSKSVINHDLEVETVAKGYESAGVCGMSVLTDTKYFGGALDDLILARASCHLPLLRKEFIINTYQILEAKAFGADVILLIAAILTDQELISFSSLAQQLGLEVLLEVHNDEELSRSLLPSVDLMGVNNRNLKTFEVSTEVSMILSEQIPNDFIKVSESGISDTKTIMELQNYGYEGFLIGENFMKTNDPGLAASNFIKELTP